MYGPGCPPARLPDPAPQGRTDPHQLQSGRVTVGTPALGGIMCQEASRPVRLALGTSTEAACLWDPGFHRPAAGVPVITEV